MQTCSKDLLLICSQKHDYDAFRNHSPPNLFWTSNDSHNSLKEASDVSRPWRSFFVRCLCLSVRYDVVEQLRSTSLHRSYPLYIYIILLTHTFRTIPSPESHCLHLHPSNRRLESLRGLHLSGCQRMFTRLIHETCPFPSQALQGIIMGSWKWKTVLVCRGTWSGSVACCCIAALDFDTPQRSSSSSSKDLTHNEVFVGVPGCGFRVHTSLL